MKKARYFIADILKANPDSNDYFIDYDEDYCFMHIDSDGNCEVFDKSFLDIEYSCYFVVVYLDAVQVLFYR